MSDAHTKLRELALAFEAATEVSIEAAAQAADAFDAYVTPEMVLSLLDEITRLDAQVTEQMHRANVAVVEREQAQEQVAALRAENEAMRAALVHVSDSLYVDDYGVLGLLHSFDETRIDAAIAAKGE